APHEQTVRQTRHHALPRLAKSSVPRGGPASSAGPCKRHPYRPVPATRQSRVGGTVVPAQRVRGRESDWGRLPCPVLPPPDHGRNHLTQRAAGIAGRALPGHRWAIPYGIRDTSVLLAWLNLVCNRALPL